MYKNGQASVSLRVEVLRDGGVYTVLHPVTPPEVQMNAASELKMSMRGEFFPPEKEVRWLTDRIRPVLILDGEEYPVGVYIGTTPKRRRIGGRETVTLEAYSVLYMAQRVTMPDGYIIREGTNYIGALQDLLQLAGIGIYVSDSTDKRIPTDRADWPAETRVIEVINELLAEINYRDVWVDLTGIVHLTSGAAETEAAAASANARLTVGVNGVKILCESLTVTEDAVIVGVLDIQQDDDSVTVLVRDMPVPETSGEPDHVYTDGQYSIISDDIDVDTDYFDKANVFRAVCSSPDLPEPMVAEVENDDPESPFSTTTLGVRIVQTEEVPSIADYAELQAKAAQMRHKALQTVETVDFVTALNPTHNTWDTVGLSVGGESGIYTEKAWRMVLDASGEMRHTVERTVFI